MLASSERGSLPDQREGRPDPSLVPAWRPGPALAAKASVALSEEDAPPAANLPGDLERFLPPRLWQSLCGATPRRGLLLNALDRLRSVLYLLASYLPAGLVQQKLRRPVPGQVRGEMLGGSLLFSDVSGFTALSERLANLDREAGVRAGAGAEQLTNLMNDYFARMLRIISRSGGRLLKFAGDALLVHFPEQEGGQHSGFAVRAALRMMEEIKRGGDRPLQEGAIQGAEDPWPGLQMKVGVGSGPFLAASVGSAERMEYVVLGETVERTMAAEELAEAGQVVVDGPTAGFLEGFDLGPARATEGGPAPQDFFSVSAPAPLHPGGGDEAEPQALDDFEIKVERRRARGAVPLSASAHAVVAQMEVALRQIKALIPFLAPEVVERIVAGARQRHMVGEFRPTTVLFANFTGVEALLAAGSQGAPLPGPGRRGRAATTTATRLLDEYFQAMQQVIARHGGVISRIDPYRHGSKMLVLFGAPVAHEDDPLRAVSAALAMNGELLALNERWQRRTAGRSAGRKGGSDDERVAPPSPPPIQQCIGITRGTTFAGEVGSPTRREYTVMGDDVNLAARLMASAGAGRILISQWVYDAAADHLEAIALPDICVKGKSQPIPIYRPVGPRDDPLARRLQARKALLGRDAEVKAGREAVRRTLAGQGGVLRISGPSGMGKSHLADELVTYALARGASTLFASCRSYQMGAPYAPWISAIRRLVGISAAEEPSAGRDRLLDRLQAWGLDLAEYGPPLCILLGLPQSPPSAVAPAVHREPTDAAPPQSATGPTLFARLQEKVVKKDSDLAAGGNGKPGLWQLMQQRRRAEPGTLWRSLQARVAARQEERMRAAVCGLLACAAAQGLLLILFEDVQWLDPASRQLLDALAPRLPTLPMLVLAVGREEAPGPADDLPAIDRLILGPLDLAGTAALVGHLLGETAAGDGIDPEFPELIDCIHQQSDGNPLFIEEMVAAMRRAAPSADTGPEQGVLWLQPAGSIQDLVLSRVDALPDGQRQVARVASVAGTDFRHGAVRALLAADFDQERVDGHLAGLEEERLILLTEAAAAKNGEPAAENGAADAAYAFRQTLVREVIYHSLSFARRRELHAGQAAYLEACLGLLQDRRHRRALGLGAYEPDAYRGPAAVVEQAELLAHHYELARSPLPAARYLLLSGHKARERYAYGQATAYYERALAALDETPSPQDGPQAAALRAAAHQGRGDVALLAGEFGAAVDAYEAACSHVEAEAPLWLEASLALVLPTRGRPQEAETLARSLWAEGSRSGLNSQERLAVTASLAWLLWRRQDAEANDWIEQGRGVLAEDSAKSPAGSISWRAGIAALLDDLAGNWDAAQRAYLALDRTAGAVLSACRQGDRHLKTGDTATALAFFERASQLCVEEDDAYGLALARYREGEALALGGDVDIAREKLREALDLLETGMTGGRQDAAHGDGGYQSDDGHLSDGEVVRAALAALQGRAPTPAGMKDCWPPWRWQSYDDALRISLIFYPGRDLERLIPAPIF